MACSSGVLSFTAVGKPEAADVARSRATVSASLAFWRVRNRGAARECLFHRREGDAGRSCSAAA